jgi:tRNA threonylcarbamoyladenosine biosynthesis protein TsaB
MPDPRATGDGRRAPAVLAFDTAGSACSVAVGRAGAVLAHEWREMRHGHAEALLPMIDRVMSVAGLDPSAVGRVAVSVGPGGFTGIRAGLAAAHGLALGMAATPIGVSSFATVAALIGESDAALLVALDSRREDLYVQLFMKAAPLGGPAAILPGELGYFVDHAIGHTKLRIAGDAAATAASALGARPGVTLIANSAPEARGVLTAVERDELVTAARALYLRAPDVSFPRRPQGTSSQP